MLIRRNAARRDRLIGMQKKRNVGVAVVRGRRFPRTGDVCGYNQRQRTLRQPNRECDVRRRVPAERPERTSKVGPGTRAAAVP